MSLATEYQRLIREARAAQLRNDVEAVRALDNLLQAAAKNLRQIIRETPRGFGGERYRRQLLASMEQVLDEFRWDYRSLVDERIMQAARHAEERERQLFQAVLAARDGSEQVSLLNVPPGGQLDRIALLRSGAEIAASFADVPRTVLERLYSRSHRDGLNLSQRFYNLDQSARRGLLDIVADGIANGRSARQMAAAITPLLETTGVDNIRFRAMRIARTEINTAFREGHIASITKPDGTAQDWVRGVGWRLSSAHPRVDICDAWAGDNSHGLGPGNYPPGLTPAGHPNCLCYTVTLLSDAPGENFVSHEAHPDEVPESQRRYYLLKP